jgi:hypothetical protein
MARHPLNGTKHVPDNGCPDHPAPKLLPLPSKDDRLKLAFHLIAEYGEDLGDYVFAQFRRSGGYRRFSNMPVASPTCSGTRL